LMMVKMNIDKVGLHHMTFIHPSIFYPYFSPPKMKDDDDDEWWFRSNDLALGQPTQLSGQLVEVSLVCVCVCVCVCLFSRFNFLMWYWTRYVVVEPKVMKNWPNTTLVPNSPKWPFMNPTRVTSWLLCNPSH
jgi:hypothetical protein